MATGESNEDHWRVFKWLGEDKQGTSYHLHPLNLVWSLDGVDHDLGVYRGAANQLAAEPRYWSAIIRDPNWRFTLVGCVCLLVSERTEYFEDLCFRFEAGSMVVPQLAVTLGLLHAAQATPFFHRVLSIPQFKKHPSKAVSAHMALIKLGVGQGPEVKAEEWNDFERDDAMIAKRVLEKHWAFWSGLREGRRL